MDSQFSEYVVQMGLQRVLHNAEFTTDIRIINVKSHIAYLAQNNSLKDRLNGGRMSPRRMRWEWRHSLFENQFMYPIFDRNFQHLDACRRTLTFCPPHLTKDFTQNIPLTSHPGVLPSTEIWKCVGVCRTVQPSQSFDQYCVIGIPINCVENK